MYPGDLQARVVSNDGYTYNPEGPITAFEVLRHDTVGCYVWYADDDSQDAAGVVSMIAAGAAAANEAIALADRLRAAKAAGQSARDAVLALHGPVTTDADSGVVSASPLSFPDLATLRQQARDRK